MKKNYKRCLLEDLGILFLIFAIIGMFILFGYGFSSANIQIIEATSVVYAFINGVSVLAVMATVSLATIFIFVTVIEIVNNILILLYER